jgi:hypothetical protein
MKCNIIKQSYLNIPFYYKTSCNLVGHSEQFQNIYIFVSNTSMETSNGSLVYNGNPNSGAVFKLPQHPPISFRYLMIRRFYASYLTICEVELFKASMHYLNT